MITANLWFGMLFEAYRQKRIIPIMGRKLIKEQLILSDTQPLIAYVNHGRWLIKCECGGAEYVWEEGYFMCQHCFNSQHKHQYRQAIFPFERLEIEKLLIQRPLDNRNWFQGESIEQLKQENEIHKAELL